MLSHESLLKVSCTLRLPGGSWKTSRRIEAPEIGPSLARLISRSLIKMAAYPGV